MGQIFISHCEEDAGIATQLAAALESAGHSAWYYERDCLPGLSYLIQTGQAIEGSGAFILLISARSMACQQVTKEVVRAHEADRHIIPILCDITHIQFQQGQPEWREALGSTASIRIESGGVPSIMPRILAALKAMGLKPSPPPPPAPARDSGAALAGIAADLDDAESHLFPDEKLAWNLARGRGSEGVPLTTDEIAARMNLLPDDVHDLLIAAGVKLRMCLHGGMPENTAMLAGRKVLVVEDLPQELEAVRRLLGQSLRMEVLVAEAEDEAVPILRRLKRSGEFAVVILDMNLPCSKNSSAPGEGGPIVGERLLLEAATHLPVIVYSSLLRMSGAGSVCGPAQIAQLRKKWAHFGALRCIEKPGLDDLLEALVSIVAITARAGLGSSASGLSGQNLSLRAGNGTLDISPRKLNASWNGRAIELEPDEFNLLLMLARHSLQEAVAPYPLLAETMSGLGPAGGIKDLLSQQVARLSRKLSDTQLRIEAVGGVGYKMQGAGTAVAPSP